MFRVDGQHREAVQDLALGGFPPRPEPGHAHGIAVGFADAGGGGFAAAPVGFEEGFDRDDAVLGIAPGVPEAGFFGDSFGAGVVGVAGDLVIGRPVRDQAEAAEQRFAFRHRVIARFGMGVAADEGALVTRPNILACKVAWEVDPKVLLEPGLVVD